MTRAVVITNPHASRAKRGLKHAIARLRAGGIEVDLLPTEEQGHGAELALAAMADGVEIVIAHGGDGTIMDVAPAMAHSGRSLGILPAGTGNRLADNLGIPWEPEAAARLILEGKPRVIDLGVMTNAKGSRHFAVASGCGFDAEIMHRTKRRTKERFGIGAYLATAIPLAMDLPRAHLRVDVDGKVLEREAVSVIIANCGEILPSGRKFSEDVHVDDGVLDVFVIDAATFASAARIAWLLAMGRAIGDPRVSVMRGQRVILTAEPAMHAQADGDPWGRTPLTVDMLAGALHVLAPPAP